MHIDEMEQLEDERVERLRKLNEEKAKEKDTLSMQFYCNDMCQTAGMCIGNYYPNCIGDDWD